MWVNRQAWAIWTTFLFFAFFMLLQVFWLESGYSEFQAKNPQLSSNIISLGMVSILFCIGVAVGVFFNQFIVFRLRDKMFGDKKEAEEEVAEVTESIQ
jgi:hypothetical protein